MSRLFRCTLNSRSKLFCIVASHRHFSTSKTCHFWNINLDNYRVPWEYTHVRRKIYEFFPSSFRFHRVAALGPDFACLEWLMNCGATCVEMTDGTSITTQKQMREFIASHGFNVKNRKLPPLSDVKPLDRKETKQILFNEKAYKERWSKVPPVYIRSVDASDSVVADPGFQFFRECYQLEKLVLGFCDFFGDPAIEHLGSGRATLTLKELEIMFNPNLSDVAFYSIAKMTSLKRAHFYFNPYVVNETAAKKRIRMACPKCYITYPEVKYIGTGKNM